MSTDLTPDGRAPGEASSGRRPTSSLYRDIGLATVATELNLQLDTLESDVAEVFERGAAALLLAGFGPNLTRRRRSVRAGEQGSRHKPLGAQGKTVPAVSDEEIGDCETPRGEHGGAILDGTSLAAPSLVGRTLRWSSPPVPPWNA
jgi:hypothetical protein